MRRTLQVLAAALVAIGCGPEGQSPNRLPAPAPANSPKQLTEDELASQRKQAACAGSVVLLGSSLAQGPLVLTLGLLHGEKDMADTTNEQWNRDMHLPPYIPPATPWWWKGAWRKVKKPLPPLPPQPR
jgi:hypothetical protein